MTAPDGTSCGPEEFCIGGSCQQALYVLTVLSGNQQTGVVDSTLNPVTVQLMDTNNNPQSNAAVTITSPSGASATPLTINTDTNGKAQFSPRLGLALGSYSWTVNATEAVPATFTANAVGADAGIIFTAVNSAFSYGRSTLPMAGTVAKAAYPGGIAIDLQGNVYYSDSNNYQIQVLAPDGSLNTLAGTGQGGSSGDTGPALGAELCPGGLALQLDSNNNPLILYVSDTCAPNGGSVRAIDLQDPSGSPSISTFAGGVGTTSSTCQSAPYGDGLEPTAACLSNPSSLLYDQGTGWLYIADTSHNAIRYVNPVTSIIGTIAGYNQNACSQPGESFYQCSNGCSMAEDSFGNLFVSGYICGLDTAQGGTYGIVSMNKADGGGQTWVSGVNQSSQTSDKVAGDTAYFPAVPYLAMDPAGNLYASIQGSGPGGNKVRMIETDNSRITTVVNSDGGPTSDIQNATGLSAGDYTPATGAQLYDPTYMAFDPAGNLWIADTYDNAVRVVASVGQVTPPVSSLTDVLGNNQTLFIDQLSANFGARLEDSASTKLGGYTVDWTALDPSSYIYNVSTLTNAVPGAGLGISPNQVRPGLQAGTYQFTAAYNDIHNNPVSGSPVTFTVNAVEPDAGTIFTAVNVTGASGNDVGPQPATLAHIYSPQTLVSDSQGNIYFSVNPYYRVLELSASGVLTLIAGTGSGSSSGDGSPAVDATLCPGGLAIDEVNSLLYVSDTCAPNGGTVRAIDLVGGSISTLAGGASLQSPYGDNGPATSANLSSPAALAVDSNSNVYIADTGHNKIRLVTPLTGTITTWLNSQSAQSLGCPQTGVDLYYCSNNYYGGCSMTIDASGVNAYVSGYVCQSNASFIGIMKVGGVGSATGTPISVVAGSGINGNAGKAGIPATTAYYTSPPATALSPTGDLYVIEPSNHVIWGINHLTQHTYVVAGNYGTQNNTQSGPNGDYGSGASALLSYPYWGSFTPSGHFAFTDNGDNAIRFVW